MHRIKVADVDAQLHCGGAEQDRQLTRPKLILPLLAFLITNLRRVLMGAQIGEVFRLIQVQIHKVGIGAAALLRGIWYPDGVVIGRFGIPSTPAEGICHHLPACFALATDELVFLRLEHAALLLQHIDNVLKEKDAFIGLQVCTGCFPKTPGQKHAKATAGAEEHIVVIPLMAVTGSDEAPCAWAQSFAVIKGPRLLQVVEGSVADLLLNVFLQPGRLDGQATAHEIEQGLADEF